MTTEFALSEFIPTHLAPSALRADDIHVRWVMPEIFHDIPIHEDNDDRAVQLLGELADRVLPGAPEDEKTKFAVMCALGIDDLLSAGAEFAGICLTAIDGAPCTATVFVSLVDSPDTESEAVPTAVKAIAAGLRRVKAGEISRIDLPCGPAVSCIGTRDSNLTGDLTETGEALQFPTSFIRVYVPLPNGTTVIMEMGTPTMDGWDVFSTMFGNIVSSIRLFRADGTPLVTTEARA
ncbi:hypothetical protein [Streptomyces sp. NPDC059861]|uniref:hypothetical protein n=1 Tax=Streptomyces sp. NPDC059861 TaxID=3346974 RepID=UPI0036527CE5